MKLSSLNRTCIVVIILIYTIHHVYGGKVGRISIAH